MCMNIYVYVGKYAMYVYPLLYLHMYACTQYMNIYANVMYVCGMV